MKKKSTAHNSKAYRDRLKASGLTVSYRRPMKPEHVKPMDLHLESLKATENVE